MWIGRSVRATRDEKRRALPGDEYIPAPIDTLTHAVTIRRAPHDVWPWLIQMGAGNRAGWYSYDWLDNGGRPSARRIVRGLQHPTVGTVFRATPGVTDGFTLLAIEPDRMLMLGFVKPDGTTEVTWTFVLEKAAPAVTRLLVRARGGPGYRFHGLPLQLTRVAVRIVHFIMERKQLLNLARRVEIVGIEEPDPLLDRFMPSYEVTERHQITVNAPADVTFAAAAEQELQQSSVIRAIFKAREMILRSAPDAKTRPRGVLAFTQSLGWGILAEVPGREVVVGAVTKPWEANPTFRALAPASFAAFADPGFVKIAWTLRADPLDPDRSIFRTETRAIATDAASRARFRRYWTCFSPGIRMIRWMLLAPLKAEAERRASRTHASCAGQPRLTDAQDLGARRES